MSSIQELNTILSRKLCDLRTRSGQRFVLAKNLRIPHRPTYSVMDVSSGSILNAKAQLWMLKVSSVISVRIEIITN